MMMKMKTVLLLLLVIFNVEGNEFRRVCYYTNWSRSVQNVQARFYITDIDVSLCTHLIYAFAKIDIATTRLVPSEPYDDNGSLENPEGGYFDFTGLKKQNPELKTMLSVGGATASDPFTKVVTNAKIRKLFAQNCVIFLRDRKFDGLDIDWEYPGKLFRDEFILLLKDLREEFDKDMSRSRLLLSVAVAPGVEDINNSYNITQMSSYVDFINVMAYDYFGSWSKVTGFVAPLWSRKSNKQFDQSLSQNWTIHRYIDGGAPRDKLVMGIRGAGVSFKVQTGHNDVGTSAEKGNSGSMRLLPSQLSYFEVCKVLLDKNAQVRYDEEQQSVYAVLGNQWVGYDNPRSVKEKVKYADEMGLGGVMFWSLDLDDYTGKYCSTDGTTYPLLSAIKNASPKPTTPSNFENPVTRKTMTINPLDRKGFKLLYVRNSVGKLQNSLLVLVIVTVVSSVACL